MKPSELLARANIRRERKIAEKTAASRSAAAAASQDAEAGNALYYIAGIAFFTMILLAPMMIITEVQSGQVSYTGEGSSLRQVGYLIILAVSIFAAVRYKGGAKALVLPWPLLLALGWCWLSLAWSNVPDVAVRRLVLSTAVVWNTFIIFQSAGYERTIRILRILLVVLLAANFATVFLDPPVGIHLMLEDKMNTALIGNWRGLMGHKNVAGAACAVTILLFMFDAKHIKAWLRYGVIIAAAYFLYKSQSKTSAGMIALATACGWIFQRYDDKIRAFAIPTIMFLSAVVWFLISTYKTVAINNFLNPSFFTGRGRIWAAMFRFSGDHLVLGSGFQSFWNVGSASPIYDYAQGWIRGVATGHSGYIDLLVSIGVPGLLLVVFAFVIWPVWRLLASRIVPQRGALAVALLLFCMGHNITESSLLERDSMIGIIMLISVAVAQNWESLGVQAGKRMGGSDVFAYLQQRRVEAVEGGSSRKRRSSKRPSASATPARAR